MVPDNAVIDTGGARSPRDSICMSSHQGSLDINLGRDLKPGKTIGMGQFGRVFLAMENETGFLIAVKEIRGTQ